MADENKEEAVVDTAAADAPATETPAPVVETPAPETVQEAPEPAVETPEPEAPVVETPAPEVAPEAPEVAPEAPAPVPADATALLTPSQRCAAGKGPVKLQTVYGYNLPHPKGVHIFTPSAQTFPAAMRRDGFVGMQLDANLLIEV